MRIEPVTCRLRCDPRHAIPQSGGGAISASAQRMHGLVVQHSAIATLNLELKCFGIETCGLGSCSLRVSPATSGKRGLETMNPGTIQRDFIGLIIS
jgi:hypothetical protein